MGEGMAADEHAAAAGTAPRPPGPGRAGGSTGSRITPRPFEASHPARLELRLDQEHHRCARATQRRPRTRGSTDVTEMKERSAVTSVHRCAAEKVEAHRADVGAL